ncbi:MAG: TldD/PmbA family protein, partial [Candidatus Bathyarchaeota archaeon]|nr:TldD/PmbA family protein [Candidatus Bathyarchaeota archaeon]
GRGMGASAIEALASSGFEMGAEIENAEISSVNQRVADMFSIRVYLGKKMGAAFTNIPSEEAVEEAVSLAISAAKATTVDEDWMALPRPAGYPEIRGLWNASVSECEPSKVVELSGDFMAMATDAEPDLIPAMGSSGVASAVSAYANSNGVAHAERGSMAYSWLGAIAKTESGVTPMIWSFDVKRSLDLDLEWAVSDIASMVRVCKKHAEGRTGKHTVIFHPVAYSQLFLFTLVQSVRGDNVARGKSMLADRIGDAIAPDFLTITDDGTMPVGANSSIADGEGVPRRKTPVIERGVLRSFLWDTYWANKMEVESTGNANRNMRQGLVDIAPSNTVVEPGGRGIRDIVSEIEHGYLVRDVQGAHSSNPESGDFSMVGNPAILIDDGEMVGAVHGLMVSGNVFELLNGAVEVADTPIVLEGLIGPEIVFKDVSVIARE